jgi:iron complex outermembrane receptor protein
MRSRSNGSPADAVVICASATLLALVLIALPDLSSAQTQNAAGTAASETPHTPNQDEVLGGLETITVTGSIIPSDIAAHRSAPIEVITSEELRQSGAENIEDYFKTQPDFVNSGQSSYTNPGAVSGNTGRSIGGTTLNLRGIGPQYTLVLVNGRRFQAEDPANVDLIPLAAIERIEVLKSGASAVYGSDAVAGVVNIITRRSAAGGNLIGSFGQTGMGDNGTARGSLDWGSSTDRLQFFGVFEYYKRDGLVYGQRSLSANPDLSRFNPNFNYFPFSYSSLAQIFLPDGTGPLVLDQRRFGCGGFSRNPADYVPLIPHLYASGCDAKLDEAGRSLINPQRKGTFFASLDYSLSNEMSIYSDFLFVRSLAHSVGLDFGADGFGDPTSPPKQGFSPVPANYYWNPFGVPIVGVSYGFPEGGQQKFDISSSTVRFNLGIKGDAGRVHYDFGGAIYYAYSNAFQYDLVTNPGYFAAEHRPGATAVNLFCNACNTPQQLAGLFGGASTQSNIKMSLVNGTAYAPVYSVPGGDITAAAGAEYRRDALQVQPADFILQHGLNDVIESPVNVERDYYAAYVEGQLPIFGSKFTLPGIAALTLDAAARYEHIQNAGSTTNPSVSIRWEPIASLMAIRASYGRSFRAPALEEVDQGQSIGVVTVTNPATGQQQNYQVIRGGNKNLKPETATYTTYGIVLTPQRAQPLTVLLDHWRLNQKNVVIQTSPTLVLEGIQPGSTFTAANGEPGVVAIFENAAGQKVEGTDLEIHYRFPTATFGSVDVRVDGTRLDSFKVNAATGKGFVEYAGSTALVSSLPSVAGLPKTRLALAANWRYRAVSTSYQLHYTGAYEDPTIGTGVTVNSYVTHDLQLNLDFSKIVQPNSWLSRVTFAIGVNDLTNAKVPVFYAGPSGGGFEASGYDTSIVNPAGRFFYGSAQLSF